MDKADVMNFLNDVNRELLRAQQLHKPMCSAHDGYAVILEEVRELEREVFQKRRDWYKVREELVQLAAMCARFNEDVIAKLLPGET